MNVFNGNMKPFWIRFKRFNGVPKLKGDFEPFLTAFLLQFIAAKETIEKNLSQMPAKTLAHFALHDMSYLL